MDMIPTETATMGFTELDEGVGDGAVGDGAVGAVGAGPVEVQLARVSGGSSPSTAPYARQLKKMRKNS